jgi:hypothetical protein
MASQSEGTLATKIPISAGTVEKSGPFSEDAAESTVRGTAGDNRVSVFNYSFCPVRDGECHVKQPGG